MIQKLINNFNQHLYICGPDLFVSSVKGYLEDSVANTESLVVET